jgi:hypothetical protein
MGTISVSCPPCCGPPPHCPCDAGVNFYTQMTFNAAGFFNANCGCCGNMNVGPVTLTWANDPHNPCKYVSVPTWSVCPTCGAPQDSWTMQPDYRDGYPNGYGGFGWSLTNTTGFFYLFVGSFDGPGPWTFIQGNGAGTNYCGGPATIQVYPVGTPIPCGPCCTPGIPANLNIECYYQCTYTGGFLPTYTFCTCLTPPDFHLHVPVTKGADGHWRGSAPFGTCGSTITYDFWISQVNGSQCYVNFTATFTGQGCSGVEWLSSETTSPVPLPSPCDPFFLQLTGGGLPTGCCPGFTCPVDAFHTFAAVYNISS